MKIATKNSSKRIKALEEEISKKQQELADLKRSLPPENVADYTFKGPDGKSVKLSALFGDKDDLIVIHNMGAHCPYCTMWADGFNGLVHHLENRAAFAVVSPDAPETQASFAKKRGWKFKMVSHQGTTFAKDMGFSFEKDGKLFMSPGLSTFHKTADGKIARIAKAEFGPGDVFNGAWHMFDLLAKGANGWEPKFNY